MKVSKALAFVLTTSLLTVAACDGAVGGPEVSPESGEAAQAARAAPPMNLVPGSC